MFRLLFALMAVATVFVGAAIGETVVRPDTTTGIQVTAADTVYSAPFGVAQTFDLNDLPDIETIISADDTVTLGDAYRVEPYVFGSGNAGGYRFLTTVSGSSRSVVMHAYIGAADSIRVRAWLYDN